MKTMETPVLKKPTATEQVTETVPAPSAHEYLYGKSPAPPLEVIEAPNVLRKQPQLCPRCSSKRSFCKCKSTLTYDPVERWKSGSRSLKSFKRRLESLERFCVFCQKTVYELLDIAAKVPQGTPQFELEALLTQYLETLAKRGIASSSMTTNANAITGFLSICNVKIKTPVKYQQSEAVYESNRLYLPDEIGSMIRTVKKLEHILILLFLAQTGQRIGLLRGLRFDMIRRLPNGWGLLEIRGDLRDADGEIVGRKVASHYVFLIHPESMRVIDQIQKQKKSEWIWTYSEGHMQRIVRNAAAKSGIQKKIATTAKLSNGKKTPDWNEVHAHGFRSFFVDAMQQGKATEGMEQKAAEVFIDFLVGHKEKFNYTYLRGMLQDDKIMAAYERAQETLSIVGKMKRKKP